MHRLFKQIRHRLKRKKKKFLLSIKSKSKNEIANKRITK